MNFIHLHCSDIYMYVCKKLYIHKLAARIYIYIFLFKFHIDGSTFFSLCFYTPFTRIHDPSLSFFILKQTLKRKKKNYRKNTSPHEGLEKFTTCLGFSPFFVLSAVSGSWVAVESEEQGV